MLEIRLRPFWRLSQQFVASDGTNYDELFDRAYELKFSTNVPLSAIDWLERRMQEEKKPETHQRRRGLRVCN